MSLDEQIDEALDAFERDIAYTIAIVERAATIRSQRAAMGRRTYARDREQAARVQCQSSDVTVCQNATACGFGGCAFATPEDAKVTTAPRTTGTARPVPGSPYDLDDVIQALSAA